MTCSPYIESTRLREGNRGIGSGTGIDQISVGKEFGGKAMAHDSHQRAAELHEQAAHAHRAAAAHHGKEEHQTDQEHSKQAMEHSAKAHQQSLEADKQSAYFATKHGKKKD